MMRAVVMHLCQSVGASASENFVIATYALFGFAVLYSVVAGHAIRNGSPVWYVLGYAKVRKFCPAWYEWLR